MSDDSSIVIMIRTIFEYGPIAVENLLNLYKQRDYANHVECKFNPINHTFVLEGDRGHAEVAFADFLDLICKATDAETSKRRAPKEYEPIYRPRLTKLNSPAVEWTEKEDEPRDSNNIHSSVVSSRDSRHVPLNPSTDTTEGYPCVEYWEPRIAAADFTLMLHLHDGRSLTSEISKVCHCALFPDWAKRNVKIGANSRTAIEKVLKKLRKIEELYKRGFEPISVILVHPEEKKTFEFKLVPLSKQSELHRTTLFRDKSKWQTYNTDKMFLIRILEWDSELDRFLPCDVSIAPIIAAFASRSSAGPRDWAEYIYDNRGSQDMNPANISRRLAPKEVQKTPDLSGINSEDLVGQYNTSKGEIMQTVVDNVPKPKPERRMQPRGDGGFELGDRPESVDLGERAMRRTITGAVRVPKIRTGKAVVEKRQEIPKEEERQEIPKEEEPKSYISGEYMQESADTPHRGEDPNNVEDDNGGSSLEVRSVIPRAFNLPERHLGTGIGRPAFSIAGSFVEKELSTRGASRTIRQPIIRKPKENIEAPDKDKEGASEADTREMRSTMGQRAPKRRGPFDEQDQSKKLKQHNSLKLYEVTSKSFEHIRSWRGHVTFEVSLGRIILADIPKSLYKHSIDWTEWQPSLTKATEIKTVFTDLITTEVFDMEFISDLKMSKAEMLFSPDHIKRVTYEFHCKYKGQNHIMEVDARTFEPTVYGEQQPFCSVYWSHPLRSWDARFALSGRKIIDQEIPVFKNLFESLWIPGGSDIPSISFLVRGKDFSVDRVVVKRETRRPCISRKVTQEQDIDLVCKEVMEMILRRSKLVPEQYKAVAHDRMHMVYSGMLHYSFALVPTRIERALQENTKLEIGEEVLWQTENLIGGNEENKGSLLTGLESLAFTVLRKIDDIGFNNNNVPDEAEFA